MSQQWLDALLVKLRDHGAEFVRYTGRAHQLWRLGNGTITMPGNAHGTEGNRARNNMEMEVERFLKKYAPKGPLVRPVAPTATVDPSALVPVPPPTVHANGGEGSGVPTPGAPSPPPTMAETASTPAERRWVKEDGGYRCLICGVTQRTGQGIGIHINVHHSQKVYRCHAPGCPWIGPFVKAAAHVKYQHPGMAKAERERTGRTQWWRGEGGRRRRTRAEVAAGVPPARASAARAPAPAPAPASVPASEMAAATHAVTLRLKTIQQLLGEVYQMAMQLEAEAVAHRRNAEREGERLERARRLLGGER